MQSRDERPEDPKDWKGIKVSLPRLAVETCPISMSELLEYINMESSEPGSATAKSLKLLRTADTGGTACWIWAYKESSGQLSYLTYRELPSGKRVLGMASASPEWNDFKLTPEQYLLAQHYDLVYWS